MIGYHEFLNFRSIIDKIILISECVLYLRTFAVARLGKMWQMYEDPQADCEGRSLFQIFSFGSNE